MNANALMLAVALALSGAVFAQPLAAPASEPGYHQRLYERYCEKLREGSEAYARFVQSKRTVHNYAYTDFAPAYPGDPVRFDCKLSNQRVIDASSNKNEPAKMAETPVATR